MNQLSRWVRPLSLVLAGLVALVLLSIPPSSPVAVATVQPAAQDVNPPKPDQITRQFAQHFQDLNLEGSIVIDDLNNNQRYEYNPKRNTTRFSPASTFKILNSLIALETGAIANEVSVLTWDGFSRSLPAWNRDLNLREAFKLSAVWFYQVLARRVGAERMQDWVQKVGYGNQKTGTTAEVDNFWLTGQLQITPQEQIAFLRRLYHNDLPFSETSLSIVKDIMIVEKTPEYTLRAKTGWFGFQESKQRQIGWYVGYLEKDKNVYFFATNINLRNDGEARYRSELTRQCLRDLGVL